MKRILPFIITVFFTHLGFTQIPSGYYDTATGSGYTLKTQLYNIINTGHLTLSYDDLYGYYETTDNINISGTDYVYDMYSIKSDGTADYYFEHVSQDQCGTYSGESDCYNREHSLPQSWFNESSPMKADLFHVYPTDGYVNNRRGSYPFGEVSSPSWTSSNGSKVGNCSYPGYSETVFEPIDDYKGDFARTYFYMATRYQNIIDGWSSNSATADDVLNETEDQVFEDWFLNMIIEWHNNDPVSQKEIDRNNAVYNIQGNRNPFIDHPEYVAQIWGGSTVNIFPAISNVVNTPEVPKSSETVKVSATITDSDGTITNAELHWGLVSGSLSNTIQMSLTTGTTYQTNSDIPSQADGVIVYYEIEATDDSSDVTTSVEYNYMVDDAITIFEEDFETITIDQPVDISDWILFNESGTEYWEGREYNSNKYAQMSAYNTGESSNVTWLITPEISLTNIESAIFTFLSKDAYYNGNPVEVFISTDYVGSGDPNSATWTNLNPTLASGSTSGYATNFTESGKVDLNPYCGNTVYIAYKYTGGDPSLTTTIQIDDLLIVGIESSNEAPVISGIANSPVSPTEQEDLTVSATITDSDGTITTVELKWGTSSGNYPNTVSMSNSGDVYSGLIPAQTGGTTVYYVIEATDNSGESTRANENNTTFTVIPNTVPEITDISNTPISPTNEDDVAVSATITDSDGTITTVELKWGTSSGNYPNTVNMSNTGNIFTGLIPAQAAGINIYYVIEATDDDVESARSDENSYEVAEVSNILPEITDITNSPLNPIEGENVTVSASITDTDGSITLANLKWGTSAGSYPNVISMNNTGDIYSVEIASQAGGTSIYYVIEATDNDLESVRSVENNFTFNTVGNVVPQIANLDFSPAVPESTENVSVSATITDADGTISSASIKWGTSTNNYPNVITMNNTGDVYSGSIPNQEQGTQVFFVIFTIDEDGGATITSENNYTVNIIPDISSISHTPSTPESDQQVSISATITDSDGTISLANIKWGTSSSVYTNTVVMSGSGDTYSGQIPAQADKTNVYYIIEVTDNNGASSESNERSYEVDDPNVLPSISEVLYDPTNPESTDKVRVSATITDSDGTVSSASIKWGTSSGTYANTIAMTGSGDSYIGEISAQADGTIVYFIIEAEDNEAGTSSSDEYNFEVNDPNILPVISNIVIDPTDPESTENVRVTATITDTDGTISSASIKWGTSSGTYTNTITMTGSGDSYIGEISAQADGTTVYLIIEAEDNEAGITSSVELDYLVEDPVNEAPIISGVLLSPESPTENDNVIISCNANDSDGSVASVLLRWKLKGGVDSDVNMNYSGGKYYGQIPAQSAGDSVFYRVIAVDDKGLEGFSEGKYEVSKAIGISGVSKMNLKIYPIPAKQFIYIEAENYSGETNMVIYDILGKTVLTKRFNLAEQEKLDLGNLESGIYFISFVLDNSLITNRIIIEK